MLIKSATIRIKQVRNPFIFFSKEYRAKLNKATNGELTPQEVYADLGKAWQELKADPERVDEYKKFLALTAKDKERYRLEKEAQTGSPKRRTGYLLFSKWERNRLAKLVPGEGRPTSGREARERICYRWFVLPEREKKMWKKKADLENARNGL